MKIKIFILIIFYYISVVNTCSSSESEMDIFSYPLSKGNISQLEAVQNELAKSNNLKGNFVQTRYIPLLSSPVVSEGDFILSKRGGLTWNQITPFVSHLIVTNNKLIQRMGTNDPVIITKEQEPIVFSFTKIFLSIFQGDTDKVKEYFYIYFKGDKSNWEIALRPRTSPLNKAIMSINVLGGRFVKKVIIKETKGTKMVIKFSNVHNIEK
jgi:hypothetical protein